MDIFGITQGVQEKWADYLTCIHGLAQYLKTKYTSAFITMFAILIMDPSYYMYFSKQFFWGDMYNIFKFEFLGGVIDSSRMELILRGNNISSKKTRTGRNQ